MSDISVKDPIVNNLLNRLKRNIAPTEGDVVSKERGEDDLLRGSGDETLAGSADDVFYPDGFDYDYLDFLLNGGVDNDVTEKDESDKQKTVYRDFPIEEGYVRIPVEYPGLTLSRIQAPNPKLWTAEESFKSQVPTEKYT